ncbi:MAG TPA: SRPBCC domain-containing protein [Jiangellaceae bacterium]
MFDMVDELAAIHRSVVCDDSNDTVSVTLTRAYDADASDVWDALTNPERLPRWFNPMSGDLQVGGKFQIEGNASGEIRRCDRPMWLQVTFGDPNSIVDVRLTEVAHKTTVELTHTVPLAMAGSAVGALFVGPGWDGALLGLGLHLRGLAVGDPVEAANSPEVIEFNRGSISRWTDAVEASGTATAEEIAGARKAAVAQYTTSPS